MVRGGHEVTNLCPECRGGKTVNCTGHYLDQYDSMTLCDTHALKHAEPDTLLGMYAPSEEVTPNDLPGMWDSSDFMGGVEDA